MSATALVQFVKEANKCSRAMMSSGIRLDVGHKSSKLFVLVFLVAYTIVHTIVPYNVLDEQRKTADCRSLWNFEGSVTSQMPFEIGL